MHAELFAPIASSDRTTAPGLRWLVLLLVGVLVASIDHATRHAGMEDIQ